MRRLVTKAVVLAVCGALVLVLFLAALAFAHFALYLALAEFMSPAIAASATACISVGAGALVALAALIATRSRSRPVAAGRRTSDPMANMIAFGAGVLVGLSPVGRKVDSFLQSGS